VPATYQVEAFDVELFSKALERFPEIARDVILETMKESIVYLVGRIQVVTPINTGTLRDSIDGRVEELAAMGSVGGAIRGIAEAGAEYALPVELGLPSGHWVPIDPLKRWAHLVLGDENAAYAVRWHIHEHGTDGYGMFAYGWRDAHPWIVRRFDRALSQLAERIVEAT